MNFLNNLFSNESPDNLFSFLVVVSLIMLLIVALGYFIDNKKNKANTLKIFMLERAIKDLIEEFRTLELHLSEQKKLIQDYKYTLEKIDQEIARLADSSSGESKITMAIQMANQGKSISEISDATNLSPEEIEPIIKYHGKN